MQEKLMTMKHKVVKLQQLLDFANQSLSWSSPSM